MIDYSRLPLIALAGPTASGKTDLALAIIEKFEKKACPCEIVSADSMLVYRKMDIGTAKPSPDILNEYPHAMINLVDPTENYNVSRYRKEASEVLVQLAEQGKGALVVGGTGLYMKALIDGLNDAPEGDPDIRSRLESEAAEKGQEALYERLRELDADAAEKIHPNNIRRVVRALEVFAISGKTFSQFHREQEIPPWKKHFKWIGISMDWADLDARIDQRCQNMFEDGLVDEVKELLNMGCQREHTAMQGLGYKEVAEGLQSGMSEKEMLDWVAQRTRRYARRQMIWWRREDRIRWLDFSGGQEQELVDSAMGVLGI